MVGERRRLQAEHTRRGPAPLSFTALPLPPEGGAGAWNWAVGSSGSSPSAVLAALSTPFPREKDVFSLCILKGS